MVRRKVDRQVNFAQRSVRFHGDPGRGTDDTARRGIVAWISRGSSAEQLTRLDGNAQMDTNWVRRTTWLCPRSRIEQRSERGSRKVNREWLDIFVWIRTRVSHLVTGG